MKREEKIKLIFLKYVKDSVDLSNVSSNKPWVISNVPFILLRYRLDESLDRN